MFGSHVVSIQAPKTSRRYESRQHFVQAASHLAGTNRRRSRNRARKSNHMATKDLSRTVIEGGRAGYSKNARYISNEKSRAQVRTFRVNAVRAADPDDVDDLQPVPKRRPAQKDFADKLGPVYRWLLSQVNRPWAKVYAELIAKFDTRTVAGRHVVFSHMLNDITLSPTNVHTSGDSFFVDAKGILRLSERNRWNRRGYYRDRNRPTLDEVHTWAAGRFVMDYSISLFWMEPGDTEWTVCGYYSGRHWYRGWNCKQTEHHDATELVLVENASKLPAVEKAKLHKKRVDGVWAYFREKPIRTCQKGRHYKQGARLSKEDLAMWARLDPRDRDALLWVQRPKKR